MPAAMLTGRTAPLRCHGKPACSSNSNSKAVPPKSGRNHSASTTGALSASSLLTYIVAYVSFASAAPCFSLTCFNALSLRPNGVVFGQPRKTQYHFSAGDAPHESFCLCRSSSLRPLTSLPQCEHFRICSLCFRRCHLATAMSVAPLISRRSLGAYRRLSLEPNSSEQSLHTYVRELDAVVCDRTLLLSDVEGIGALANDDIVFAVKPLPADLCRMRS